jgi:3-oxoacyl-[acyl-carrier protein] reductase
MIKKRLQDLLHNPKARANPKDAGDLTPKDPDPEKVETTPVPAGELAGKVALVTGGNRGIGAAIALALAEAGADVVVNYLTGESEARDVQTKIRALDRECITVGADVSSSVEVAGMLTAIERQLEHVSIFVHCVGLFKPKPFLEIDESDWNKILGINLKSAFLITQAVVPSMIENRWGRIIYMASMVSQMGAPNPHYVASKAGIIGLTRSYAGLLARHGITVNAIAPALIATENPNPEICVGPEMVPVGRFGKVQEVSDVAMMLVRSGYITGQTINVNGGVFMT